MAEGVVGLLQRQRHNLVDQRGLERRDARRPGLIAQKAIHASSRSTISKPDPSSGAPIQTKSSPPSGAWAPNVGINPIGGVDELTLVFVHGFSGLIPSDL